MPSPSDLFELAAAISRSQLREVRPPQPLYDNSACCQRCGRSVRIVSSVPATGAALLNFVCMACCSGESNEHPL